MAGHVDTGNTFGEDNGGTTDPFMEDQLSVHISFPLGHDFLEDYGLDEEDDEVYIDGESLFFEQELTSQANAKKKRKSKQTKSYTKDEDKLLCECWRDIDQNPKIGSEKKASAFWQQVHREFHERKKFKPYQIESKRGWVLLGKRSRVIQQECNKFCAILESIEARTVSGLSIKDMVFEALKAFRAQYESKSFYLTHCWMISNREEKFKAQCAAIKARGGKAVVEEHGEGKNPRPRGKTNSRKEDKR
ncbi:Auxin response factor 3 [Hordeum vulgare]|nr:Auxin response factor 3 [Hordeum vulgare]